MGRKRRHKLRKNPAAIIAATCLAFVAFVSPLVQTKFFGEGISDPNFVMVNLIKEVFSGKSLFGSFSETILFIMVLVFLVSFVLYLFNGFGSIYHKFSRYASYLTIIYLFLGLYLVNLLNQESVSFFGITLTSVSISSGIYLVPIIGVLYLFFKKPLNKIRF